MSTKKIIEADTKSQQWLSRLNQLEEAGKSGTKAHQTAERKAQYWLDRLDTLLGQ